MLMLIRDNLSLKRGLSFGGKNRYKILTSYKIIFNYIVVNQGLFNFYKLLFTKGLHQFKFFSYSKNLFRANSRDSFFSRSLVVCSPNLEILFDFNEFIRDKGVVLTHIVYFGLMLEFRFLLFLVRHIPNRLKIIISNIRRKLFIIFFTTRVLFFNTIANT